MNEKELASALEEITKKIRKQNGQTYPPEMQYNPIDYMSPIKKKPIINQIEKNKMTTYEVDGWNNFCRVFEIPKNFSNEFCFRGGIPHTFHMVDWFNPIPRIPNPAISKEAWLSSQGGIETKSISYEDLWELVVPFVKTKRYIKQDAKYLILFNFGAAITFEGE